MKDKIIYEKLNEEDILEIVMEHLQEKHNDLPYAKIIFLGEKGKDLRCVCAVSDEIPQDDIDLIEIDKSIDFTGDHDFISKHSDFLL